MKRWRAKLLIWAETIIAYHYSTKSEKAALLASAKHWYRNARLANKGVPYHRLIKHDYTFDESLRCSDTCSLCHWCKDVTKKKNAKHGTSEGHCWVCPLKDDPVDVCCEQWMRTRLGGYGETLAMFHHLVDKYTTAYQEKVTIYGVTYYPHDKGPL